MRKPRPRSNHSRRAAFRAPPHWRANWRRSCRRCGRGARSVERAMIRVALYLIVVGLIAYGVALVADRPGDVVVTWQGWRIETSLLVLAAAVIAAVAVLSLIFAVIRSVARSPM